MKNQTIDPNERIVKILTAPPAVQEEIDRVLNGKIAIPKAESGKGPLLLSMSNAAKYLGCSRATLWRMLKAKRLNKVEVLPGSFRIRRTDLDALVEG